MKEFFFWILTFSLAGCTSAPVQVGPVVVNPRVAIEKKLEKEDFQGALEESDRIAKVTTSSEEYLQMQLLKGASLEGLKQWRQAITAYESVIGTNKQGVFGAEALYRLSHCFEAIGDDSKTLAALKDLQPRRQQLDAEIALAELPGRQAAAYARLGDELSARAKFLEAEAGLKKLRLASKEEQPIWLARTLYFMGQMPRATTVQFDELKFLRQLEVAQNYLIRSAEIGDEIWSARSSFVLIDLYKNIWTLILDEKVEDASKRLPLAITFLETLNIAQHDWSMHRVDANDYLQEIGIALQDMQMTVEKFLRDNSWNLPLTEDAKRREGIYRPGRVVGSETILEQEALQRMKNKERKTKDKP